MDFKKSKFKNKKIIVTSIIGILLGSLLGFAATISPEEFAENNKRNETIVTQVQEKESEINSSKNELTLLVSKESELKKQKEDIIQAEKVAKEEAEKRAKEEAERIAKEEAEKVAEAARLAQEAEAVRLAQEEADRIAQSQNQVSYDNSWSNDTSVDTTYEEPIGQMVWKTKTGSKYHSHNNCGNTNSANATQITIGQAQNLGLTACSKCY